MRIIIIIVLIFLALITILDIVANKINAEYVRMNIKLESQNKVLKDSLLCIRGQLRLMTFKECPEEEKDKIVQENIKFIDEIEKVW